MSFQADHRIDEPRRKRRQYEPHYGEVQEAYHVNPRQIPDVVVRTLKTIDVEKIQSQQAEENQKLRPLYRVAPQQPPVLHQQELQWRGKHTQARTNDAVRQC